MKKKAFFIFLTLICLLLFTCACTKTDMKDTKTFFKDNKGALLLSNNISSLTFDATNGYFDLKSGKNSFVKALSVSTDEEGTLYYLTGNDLEYSTETVTDDIGSGISLTVKKTFENISFSTIFTMYDGKNGMTVRSVLSSLTDSVLASNYICPIDLGESNRSQLDLGNADETFFVEMPFDNDNYNRYVSKEVLNTLKKTYFSSEVTAIYNSQTKNSLVIGSLEHDNFKSGIELKTDPDCIRNLAVYAGAANSVTRDESGLAHGYVYGKEVSSPLFFVGFFDSYVDGLDSYADYSAIITPPLTWNGGTIVGWNSWGALADKVNYDEYVATADFYNDNLDFDGNTVYINLDSFWGDNIPPEKIREAVEHIHQMGMKTGAYCTPYVLWWDADDWDVPGTNGQYKYRDIYLRDPDGNKMKIRSSYLSLDPTHPGTIMNIEYQLQQMLDYGFDYVKMDFLSNGAIEGVHYEPGVTTGIQAYNYGMSRIRDFLSEERIGKDFFISLSIAPLFPSQYAHARRISCDAFSSIDSTEYMLNSLTYGWWQNGKIYPFTDPDHCVLYKPFNNDPSSDSEAVARFNSALISGTVLLGSDKLYNKNEAGELVEIEEAVSRTEKLYQNTELLSVGLKKTAFKPYSFCEGGNTSTAFYSIDENYLYVAVFNYNKKKSQDIELNLSSFLTDKAHAAVNLNTKETLTVKNKLELTMEAKSSYIFRISLK